MFPMVPPPMSPPIIGLQIRPVTAANMELELAAITSLLPAYPYITIDTEYAGAVHHHHHRPSPPPPSTSAAALLRRRPPPERYYELMKANVDAVPIVQLGVTLSDEHGNIPLLTATSPILADGHHRQFVEVAWEVTFSDFDDGSGAAPHAPDSVEYLRSQGVDFAGARAHGVPSAAFGAKLARVLAALPRENELTWAAFGGAHDFGYLVKVLAGDGRPLPDTWHGFMALAKAVLGGGRVFDGRYMTEHCARPDLCGGGGGGLRGVAASLGVPWRFHGVPYLAAQKSHTACLVFMVIGSF